MMTDYFMCGICHACYLNEDEMKKCNGGEKAKQETIKTLKLRDSYLSKEIKR